jgi:bifunctional UDP-N-acetylglucosamine pyrophosphorylase/glucosamine-1-phosphate N-acetyltransferase
VILAAGQGTRMRSRTPKVLHEICGRPMIDWVLDAALAAKPDDVRVVLSPNQDEVAKLVGTRAKVVYQAEQMGTGHAVMQVPRSVLSSGTVLVLNGDSPLLRGSTVAALVKSHRRSRSDATLATVTDPSRRDGLVVRDAKGGFQRVVELKHVQRSDGLGSEFNVGLYCFNGRALVKALGKLRPDQISGELYLPEVLGHVSRVGIVRVGDRLEALGVNDRVQLAQALEAMRGRILEHHMLAGVTVRDPSSTFVDAGVEIGQDTVIEPFSVIKGKTRIGSECRIGPHVHIEDATIGDRSDCGPFAKLRPGTQIAPDVHIGSFAELVRTRVGQGSKVPHVSYLGDTDLGKDANIGAGTITANFDGTRKNRTSIGDGAFVGVDTMLVAPVKLGSGSRTGAGSVVTKDVPDGATAVGVPARVVRRKPVDSEAK